MNRYVAVAMLAFGALAGPCVLAQTPAPPATPPAPAASSAPAPAPAKPAAPRAPAYQLLRYEEDWSFLREPSRRSDFWDPIKFIPLNDSGTTYLSLGGEMRVRYEGFRNSNFGSDVPPNNGYLLQRHSFHADLHAGSHVRVFGQVLSALENGREGGARSIDEDQLDLHQAFLELRFRTRARSSWFLRTGRQEMDIGSSRLMATREPQNVRQRFDGVRFEYLTANQRWRVGALATRPVIPKAGVFDDIPDHRVSFTGGFISMPNPLIRDGRLAFYWAGFWRKASRYDQGIGAEYRNTYGTRFSGARSGFDYNYELIVQTGSFGRGQIRAWTVATDSGYLLRALRYRPRLGLGFDISSGDRNRNDTRLQTYNALFANNAYSTKVGLIGPANSINLIPSVRWRLGEGTVLLTDWGFFWRQSVHDGTYFTSGGLQRSGRNNLERYVGSQPSLQFNHRFTRHLDITAIYTHIFPGPFLRKAPPARHLDYVTTYLTYRF